MNKTHAFVKVAIVAASLMLSSGRGALADEANTDPLVVVVSATSSLRDISVDELRRLYRDSSGTVDGEKLIPLNLRLGSSARSAFDRRVHGWRSAEAARYWTDRRIRGAGMPPKELDSAVQIQMLVFRYPHLVGYVRASEFRPDKLRAITVDGQSYGAREYPLR